jgi:hydroxyacylglutathione hydrolase
MRTLMLVTSAALCGCFPERVTTTVGDVTVRTFQHDFTNVHAVVHGGKVVLIDSGLERNAERLEADLLAEGLSPRDVVAVVLTHGHADHAGGARRFQEAFGAKVIAGRGDATLLAEGRNDPLCPTSADARDRLPKDQAETYRPVVPDVLLDGPASLEALVGVAGELLPVPGHTEGSLALKVGASLFVGDLLRGAIFTKDADVHFYMCDLDDNANDIDGLLEAHPDASTWFVGHFGPLTRAAVQTKFQPQARR